MSGHVNVVFCLPGRTFSSNYFNSWNATISELQKRGMSYAYSIGYDPVVYYARNKLLGGQNTAGKSQKPWQGRLSYDRVVWIDSDMVWSADDVVKLISSDKDVISGTYLMEDGNTYPVVEHLDYNRLLSTGSFEFIKREDMVSRVVPFKVSYTGFGFVSAKAGVFESMEYPWFQPRWISNPSFHDFCAEDVGFCWAAQELGYDIWVDPTIRVGHEKMVVL